MQKIRDFLLSACAEFIQIYYYTHFRHFVKFSSTSSNYNILLDNVTVV